MIMLVFRKRIISIEIIMIIMQYRHTHVAYAPVVQRLILFSSTFSYFISNLLEGHDN